MIVSSCGEPDFLKFEGEETSYQICPGTFDIIRTKYSEDGGAPALQLFDKYGKLLEDITINPIARFLITSIKNSSIQITYFVGAGRDFDFFIQSFRHDKYNPSHIGNYSIKYRYEIENGYSEKQGGKVDSIGIDKQKKTVALFSKKALVINLPMCLLSVNISGLTSYDVNTKTHVYYAFEKKGLFQDYLLRIVNIYSQNG
ncbi:hypothetical protein [Mucilaginibacter flavidus]|uniref:hypothetical protein n=1 Tax=Mucilaginibacter flavidus TaxID=2949309 RepID=UPI0020931E16|nr:hypothetical protein [Mucilaginibacter flavidus]MCO5950975.1 hypothetical protein [Mucilaginibacter flavidus]